MNKKFVYSLVLTSIFVMSILAVCIQPVAADTNWKFGVPKEAKGMKLQSEVKVYDKDQWGNSLGYCAGDTCNQKFGGEGTSANNVGARSQSEISDWEREDIWFFGDNLMTSDVPLACDGQPTEVAGTVLTDYWSAAVVVEDVLHDMGKYAGTRADWTGFFRGGQAASMALYLNPADPNQGKMGILESVMAISMLSGVPSNPAGWGLLNGTAPGVGAFTNALWVEAQAVTDLFAESTYTRAEISAKFSKTYKGTLLTREKWDFAQDLESDPDEDEDEVPFIENPEDLFDSFEYFNGFLAEEFDLIDNMIYSLINLNETYQSVHTAFGGALNALWHGMNSTFGKIINGSIYKATGYNDALTATKWAELSTYGFLQNTFDTLLSAYLAPEGDHPLQSGTKGLLALKPFFVDAAPGQDKEYLAMILENGIPAHQPVDKWLEDLIDAFDIDDDAWFGDDVTLYSDIILRWAGYEMIGVPVTDDLHTGGISVDGLVVTVEYEWPEGLLNNPLDLESQRDDYEVVYTYGDTGGQSKIEFFSGDDLFYQTESIAPTIPGYEVSILLGAAAIATLGLIFVVVKKRRM
jgi:hypothetical protein